MKNITEQNIEIMNSFKDKLAEEPIVASLYVKGEKRLFYTGCFESLENMIRSEDCEPEEIQLLRIENCNVYDRKQLMEISKRDLSVDMFPAEESIKATA